MKQFHKASLARRWQEQKAKLSARKKLSPTEENSRINCACGRFFACRRTPYQSNSRNKSATENENRAELLPLQDWLPAPKVRGSNISIFVELLKKTKTLLNQLRG